jgi:hypothetical protein
MLDVFVPFGVPRSRLNRVSKASKLELQIPEVTA